MTFVERTQGQAAKRPKEISPARAPTQPLRAGLISFGASRLLGSSAGLRPANRKPAQPFVYFVCTWCPSCGAFLRDWRYTRHMRFFTLGAALLIACTLVAQQSPTPAPNQAELSELVEKQFGPMFK